MTTEIQQLVLEVILVFTAVGHDDATVSRHSAPHSPQWALYRGSVFYVPSTPKMYTR